MKTQSTPETDAFAIKFVTPCGEKYWVPVDIARKLERQLDEAKRQRDRLAEALLSVIDEDGTPMSIDRANKILQSLIENEPISK